MNEYTPECLEYFLAQEDRRVGEPVAGTRGAAEAFHEESMEQVVPTLREVRAYLDESGMDVTGMTDEELLDQSEIFPLPDGTYLIVEG